VRGHGRPVRPHIGAPAPRTFFELTVPSPGMVATAILTSSASIGALTLCGYSLRTGPAPLPTT
jgi:hypothetical protein